MDGGDPINGAFEVNGFETRLIMHNLGSVGIYIFCLVLIWVVYPLIKRINFLSKVSNYLDKNLHWGAPLRMITESFIINAIAILINLQNPDFTSQWGTFNTILSVLLSLTFNAFLVATPIFLK